MTPQKLAEVLKEFLVEIGSKEVKIIDSKDANIRYPATHANKAIICTDKDVPLLFQENQALVDLSCGSDGIFALPYGEHSILIFSDEDSHEQPEIQNF